MCKFFPGMLFAVFLFVLQAVLSDADMHAAKERIKLFNEMDRAMQPVIAMLQGKQAFDRGAVLDFSQTVVEASARLPDSFPKSAAQRPSDALPGVWQENARFVHLFDVLSSEASMLGEAAKFEDSAAVSRQFALTIELCDQCHRDFREGPQSQVSELFSH